MAISLRNKRLGLWIKKWCLDITHNGGLPETTRGRI